MAALSAQPQVSKRNIEQDIRDPIGAGVGVEPKVTNVVKISQGNFEGPRTKVQW
jgi:formylmethanofuran:tetrahydromethanopterin formyltransferase